MLRVLSLLVLLASAAVAADPPQTSSRVFELAQKHGTLDQPETRAELQRIVDFANLDLVPALRAATRIELFSLEPKKYQESPKGTPLFHGYKILGRLNVEPAERVETLKRSLITGIGPAMAVLCYSPRHGIRLTGKGGAVVDLEICFECGQSAIYGLPKRKWPVRLTFIGVETEDLLNAILDEAGIDRDLSTRRTPKPSSNQPE
jgi:hypothetical protein